MNSDEDIDFGKKKKKKVKSEKKAEKAFDADFEAGELYKYETLLTRLHETIAEKNAVLLNDKKRYKLVPPVVQRVGSKKVGWVNFGQIADLMNRDRQHIFNYFLAEFGTEGSIAAESGQMILKGRFTAKHIESLLKRYIVEYVTCNMCKSPDTTLVRDSSTRLMMMTCKVCGSGKSVAAIKSGYHATNKTDRKKAKAAKLT